MLCYCGVMVVRHVKMLKVRALPQSLNCSLSSNINSRWIQSRDLGEPFVLKNYAPTLQ